MDREGSTYLCIIAWKRTKRMLKIQEQIDSQERHHYQVSVSIVGLVLMEFIRADTQETRSYH